MDDVEGEKDKQSEEDEGGEMRSVGSAFSIPLFAAHTVMMRSKGKREHPSCPAECACMCARMCA